jgi:hypothetical protein
MYSIVDPSEALKRRLHPAAAIVEPLVLGDVAGIAIAVGVDQPLAVFTFSRPSGVTWIAPAGRSAC